MDREPACLSRHNFELGASGADSFELGSTPSSASRVSGPALLLADPCRVQLHPRDLPQVATVDPVSSWESLDGLQTHPTLAQLQALVQARLAAKQARLEGQEDGPPGKRREQVLGPGLRARVYGLHDGMVAHGLAAPPIRKCGRCRIAPNVDVVLRSGGGEPARAYYRGLAHCGSVWACPVCSNKIRVKRAKEIQQLVEAHGQARTLMLSLTVRHGMGDELASIVRGITLAWAKVQQGSEWRDLLGAHGARGFIRALETTYGANGWHPHFHMVVFLDRSLEVDEVEALREALSVRWRQKVRLVLGSKHQPDDEHGCDLRPLHAAEYIAKMGLELTDPFTKEGRGGSRTPWQVATDAVSALDQRDAKVRSKGRQDAKLWTTYTTAMKGRKMLNYTRFVQDLRRQLGLVEKSDKELSSEVEGQEADEDVQEVLVAQIDRLEWRAVRCVRGARGQLLDLVERGHREEGVRYFIECCSHTIAEGEEERLVMVDDDRPDRLLDAPA